MRNILLTATAAVALVGVVSAANAQAPAPVVNTGRAGWVGAPNSSLPSNDNDPGSVKVFLRGRMWFDAEVLGDSNDRAGGNKTNPMIFGSFARLYPSFEGVTANGLKYGAFLEVRQTGIISSTSTGVTANNTGPGGNASNQALIFRRETGYLGGSWGTVRFGATDAVMGLFMTGTFENFDNGGSWNGDMLFNSNTDVTWPFPENSGSYSNEKIVYLSPSFSGFDFGISFEPNSVGSGEANNGAASSGAPRLTGLSGIAFAGGGTLGGVSQLQRPRNTVEVAGRYQGNIGPAAVTVAVSGFNSALVSNSGLTGTAGNGSPQYKFKTPNGIDIGATVAFGGLAVGGNYYTGAVNPNGTRNEAPVIAGGTNAQAFVLGTSYAFGSFIVGANYLNVLRQGFNAQDQASGTTVGSVGKMREWGIDIGGTYGWGPGAALSASYYYGERHQNGINVAAGGGAGKVGNNTHAQGIVLTQFFNW